MPKDGIIRLLDFTGGVHKEKSDAQLKPNEFPDLVNFRLGVDGRLHKRPGHVRYNAASLGASPILGAHRYKGAGSPQLLVVHGSSLYTGDDATGALASVYGALTPGQPARLHTWKELAFLVNGSDGLLQWNGAAVSAVAGYPGAGAAAKYLTHYADRLFVAVPPDTLRYSEQLDPTAWQHTDPVSGTTLDNLINLSVGDDNPITGMWATEMHLSIFKERAIYYLRGYDPTQWENDPVTHGFGCVAPRSLAELDGALFFLSHLGVMTDNGQGFERVSAQVQPILDACTKAQLSTAAGVASGYAYRLALPDHPDGPTTLIYDLRLKEWSVDQTAVPIGGFVAFNVTGDTGQLAAWDAVNGLVYYADQGGTDDGAAITATLTTARMNLASPDIVTRLRHIGVEAILNAGDVGTVKWIRDGAWGAPNSAAFADGLTMKSIAAGEGLARDLALQAEITGTGQGSELVGLIAETRAVRRRWTA